MTNFIFMTGSETHAGAWDSTRSCLRQRGFNSRLIDWSGTPWDLGLERAVERLLKGIEIQSDSVLVGHSIAGLFLPLVANAISARCEIYLSALTPKPGVSFFDQLLDGDDPFDGEWAAGYSEMSRSKNSPITHRGFLEHFLFHDCSPNAVDVYWKGMEKSAEGVYLSSYPAAPLQNRRRAYIVCSKDRALRPEWQRHAAFESLGIHPVEIASGHCPQLAMPSELAQLLEEISELRS
jgi:hypothetical protein